MKRALLSQLCCPQDEGSLELRVIEDIKEEILVGELTCVNCKKVYSIKDGIPRFLPEDHYSSSFGWQWNRYEKTQLDSHTGLSITEDRKNQVCSWTKPDKGWGMEAGCGAGRFSEILAKESMDWVCVDSSSAVEANFRNNGHRKNIHIVQADLRYPPFRQKNFDRLICLGVLQHTPDPKESFFRLLPLLADHGEFAFDIYSLNWDTFLWSKYWFRPFTKNIPDEKLFEKLKTWVPVLIRCHDILRLIPWIGRRLAHRLIPVCNYKYSFPFSKEQNLEWALLDTFDMLAPAHDHPVTGKGLRSWLENVSERKTFFRAGPNGWVGMVGAKVGKDSSSP